MSKPNLTVAEIEGHKKYTEAAITEILENLEKAIGITDFSIYDTTYKEQDGDIIIRSVRIEVRI